MIDRLCGLCLHNRIEGIYEDANFINQYVDGW